MSRWFERGGGLEFAVKFVFDQNEDIKKYLNG